MNKTNILFGVLIVVTLLILGGIGFFFYRMYDEIKATQADVKATAALIEQKFSLATSTDPLVQLGQGVVSAVAQLNMNLVQEVKATPAPSTQK